MILGMVLPGISPNKPVISSIAWVIWLSNAMKSWQFPASRISNVPQPSFPQPQSTPQPQQSKMLSKAKVQEILANRPAWVDPSEILVWLQQKWYVLEWLTPTPQPTATQDMPQPESSSLLKNVVWWALESAKWIPKIAFKAAEWPIVSAISSITWVPTEKVRQWYETQVLWDTMWDKTSIPFQATKMVWDIWQAAAAGSILSSAVTGTWIWRAISAIWNKWLLGKIWLWAAWWIWEQGIYNAVADQRLPTSWEMALAWLVGGAVPLAWYALKWAAWSAKKLAAKLETSGIMNPAKFDSIKNKLIEEGVDKAGAMKSEDVANWMLQRGLKGSKEQIADKALQISEKSQEAKKGILQLSNSQYAPKEAKFVIDDMLKELKWSASDEFRTLYWELSWMKAKLQKWWLTLSDLDYIRGKAWDVLNPFTASWKVVRSQKDTKNVISGLKRFIENTAEKEWLASKAWYQGKNIIRDLNNQTSIAKELWDAVLRKESTDARAEIISFLSSRWWGLLWWGILWSQVWPFDGNTIEWKIGNVLVWALVWSAAWSTKIKSNLANYLNKLSWAEKSALYEWMKSKWSKEATQWVKNMLNSVSTILSKQTNNDLRPMRSPIISPVKSSVDSSILPSRASVNAPSWTVKVTK